MIMAQGNTFQNIFIISMLDLWQKLLQYVEPVAWQCISNKIKILPLHIFSLQVKSQLLAWF